MTHTDQKTQHDWIGNWDFQNLILVWFSTVVMLYEDCSRILQLWVSKVMKPHFVVHFSTNEIIFECSRSIAS